MELQGFTPYYRFIQCACVYLVGVIQAINLAESKTSHVGCIHNIQSEDEGVWSEQFGPMTRESRLSGSECPKPEGPTRTVRRGSFNHSSTSSKHCIVVNNSRNGPVSQSYLPPVIFKTHACGGSRSVESITWNVGPTLTVILWLSPGDFFFPRHSLFYHFYEVIDGCAPNEYQLNYWASPLCPRMPNSGLMVKIHNSFIFYHF